MDAETLKTLVALGEHGGSVAMLIAVFIAGRASRAAAEAVDNLKAIRASLEAGLGSLQKAATEQSDSLATIRREVAQLPLQVVSAVSRRA